MVPADLEPSSEKARRHQTTFVGRRQEINIQFNQLIEAVLLVLAIWLAHSLRAWLGFLPIPAIEPFGQSVWLVAPHHAFRAVVPRSSGDSITALCRKAFGVPSARSPRPCFGPAVIAGSGARLVASLNLSLSLGRESGVIRWVAPVSVPVVSVSRVGDQVATENYAAGAGWGCRTFLVSTL
jgi:hypothetical protein